MLGIMEEAHLKIATNYMTIQKSGIGVLRHRFYKK